MNLDYLLKSHTIVFDLDGVVYRGGQLINGAEIGINQLRGMGKEIRFLTNSSARGSADVSIKLNALGVYCHEEEVMTSATASAIYLYENNNKNIYVVGEPGLKCELSKYGLTVVDDPEKADALLVGVDTEISYQKIAEAMVCIQFGCHFVTCNRDPNYPVSKKKCLPGCGPMISAIESASEKKVDFVVGKPTTYILEKLLKAKPVSPSNIVIVGDSIKSDIGLAMNFGALAVHVDEQYFQNETEVQDNSYYKFKSVYDLSETLINHAASNLKDEKVAL
jgi:HAD superfamily hydrolase (TIGR01450 family)